MLTTLARLMRGVGLPALLCLALASAPALAEEPQNDTQAQNNATKQNPAMSLTMRLYEGVISCPMPYWVKEPRQIGQSNFFRDAKRGTFTFEMIPKPQQFSSWTRLYGVYGFYLPQYDMKQFFDASLNFMANGCKGQAKGRILSSSDDVILFDFYCPELAPEQVTNGNTVERGFLFLARQGKSFAKVYQAWRGPANATESEDWPTNPKLEEQAIAAMKAMRFMPAK